MRWERREGKAGAKEPYSLPNLGSRWFGMVCLLAWIKKWEHLTCHHEHISSQDENSNKHKVKTLKQIKEQHIIIILIAIRSTSLNIWHFIRLIFVFEWSSSFYASLNSSPGFRKKCNLCSYHIKCTLKKETFFLYKVFSLLLVDIFKVKRSRKESSRRV